MSQLAGIFYKYGNPREEAENILRKNIDSPCYQKISGEKYTVLFWGNPRLFGKASGQDGETYFSLGNYLAGKASAHDSPPESLIQCMDNPQTGGGHYILGELGKGITLINDRYGVKALYYFSDKMKTVFSTRLDVISRITGYNNIDPVAFSGHWIGYNQFSPDRSLIKNIFRLPPGSILTINETRIAVKKVEDAFTASYSVKEPEKSILSYFPQIEDNTFVLGLSGGLDSRLLFALLYSKGVNFKTFTFGEEDDPDVKIAKAVSAEYKIPCIHVKPELPSGGNLTSLLKSYISRSNLVSAVPDAVRLNSYEYLRERDIIYVDGAFGEIGRCKYYNKIRLTARKAVRERNYKKIYNRVRLFRADIFTEEFSRQLREGALIDISQSMSALPPPEATGIDNFLDIFAVRSRLPNVYGYEQQRLDDYFRNFMPFAQPEVINLFLKVSPTEKKHGRLFKKIISRNTPDLSQIPVYSGNSKIPFKFYTVLEDITKIATKIFPRKKRVPLWRRELENRLKEYAGDTVNSAEFKSYPLYDLQKVLPLANNFALGRSVNTSEVLWLISFELWRNSLKQQ